MPFTDKNGRRAARLRQALLWLPPLCCLLLLAACAEPKDDPQARYLRAVYVLRAFGGPAAAEEEDIPKRIIYSDETESLLHHRDKIFVLGKVAGDLAGSRAFSPRAPLYEAYARLALGEKQTAAALLTAYVVENEYRRAHYALLCETLYSLQEYASLLLICYEWGERDKQCQEERSRLTFAALFNLGRLHEAVAYAGGQKGCLHWQAAVYQARALLALGEGRRADRLVETAMRDRPDEASQVRRLWDIVRAREKM